MHFRFPISENYPHFLWRALSHPRKALKGLTPVRRMPSYVWIEITSRCQMRCRSCSKFYQRADPGVDMRWDLFDSILSQTAPYADCVNLTGVGEPLVHRDAERIFDRLMDFPHPRFEFITNGQLLDEAWIKRLSRIRCTAVFSIDGTTADTYRFNRPGADLEKVRRALERARQEQLASPDPGSFPFRRGINFLIMRRNMHQIPEIVQWAADYGCQHIAFNLMNNWGCPDDFWREQNPLNYRRELVPLLRQAKTLLTARNLEHILPEVSEDAGGKDASVPQWRFSRFFKPSQATRRGFPRFEDRSCPIPFRGIYFSADGRASPCCAAATLVLGDARTQSVASIWNGFPYRRLRMATLVGSHNSYCRTCELACGLGRGNPRDLMK